MATSGSESVTVTNWDTLKFSWWRNSYSIPNNTTTISWKMELIASSYGRIDSSTSKSWSVNINGTKYGGNNSVAIDNETTKTLASGTTTINHNSDGTKTFSYSFSQYFGITFSGKWIGTVSGSGSDTLDSIPRQATITSAPNFDDSNYSPVITYSNPAGNSVQNLDACISLTGESSDVSYENISKTGDTHTFGISEAEMNTLRQNTASSKSRNVIFYVRTTLGGKYYYSTLKKTFTVINADPSFTAEQISYADSNPVTKAVTGDDQKIIQNKSTLSVSFTAASGQKYAGISSYTVTVGGTSKTVNAAGTVNCGAINASSNTSFTVRATDTRGYYKDVSKGITVLAYGKPSIAPCTGYGNIICERCDDEGTPDDSGEKLKITVKGQWYSLPGKLNSGTLKLKYASKTYTSGWISLNGEAQGGEATDNYISYIEYNGIADGVSVSADTAYTVTVRCEDTLGEYSEVSFNIPTEDVCFHLGNGGNKAAFGKYAENTNTLEIAEDWTLNVLGNMAVKGSTVAAFITETGSSGIWTYRKWSDGTAECWGRKSYGLLVESSQGAVYYSTDYRENLPSGLFTSVTSWSVATNDNWSWTGKAEANASAVVFRVARGSPWSDTTSLVYAQFIIKGRWK